MGDGLGHSPLRQHLSHCKGQRVLRWWSWHISPVGARPPSFHSTDSSCRSLRGTAHGKVCEGEGLGQPSLKTALKSLWQPQSSEPVEIAHFWGWDLPWPGGSSCFRESHSTGDQPISVANLGACGGGSPHAGQALSSYTQGPGLLWGCKSAYPPEKKVLGWLQWSSTLQPGEWASRGWLIFQGEYLHYQMQLMVSKSAQQMLRGTLPKWDTPPRNDRLHPGLGRWPGRHSEQWSEVPLLCWGHLWWQLPWPAWVNFQGSDWTGLVPRLPWGDGRPLWAGQLTKNVFEMCY